MQGWHSMTYIQATDEKKYGTLPHPWVDIDGNETGRK